MRISDWSSDVCSSDLVETCACPVPSRFNSTRTCVSAVLRSTFAKRGRSTPLLEAGLTTAELLSDLAERLENPVVLLRQPDRDPQVILQARAVHVAREDRPLPQAVAEVAPCDALQPHEDEHRLARVRAHPRSE